MCQQTLSTAVAKALTAKRFRGNGIYNDRLKDGRRSLKVRGWNSADYREAASILKLLGCTVEIKEFNSPLSKFYKKPMPTIRLIVREPML